MMGGAPTAAELEHQRDRAPRHSVERLVSRFFFSCLQQNVAPFHPLDTTCPLLSPRRAERGTRQDYVRSSRAQSQAVHKRAMSCKADEMCSVDLTPKTGKIGCRQNIKLVSRNWQLDSSLPARRQEWLSVHWWLTRSKISQEMDADA